MSLVSGCRVSLALEDMSQMASTVGAHNLCSLHAKSAVDVSGDGTWNCIEEGGPAATRLELVVCLVDGSVATSAVVYTLGGCVLVVLSGEWWLGTLLSQDAELLCSKC